MANKTDTIMSKIDRNFWNSLEGMTLAEVEATAIGFYERWREGHAKQDFERLGDCLIHRAGLLNDGFRLTDEEFERFRAVAEMFIEKTAMMHRNARRVYTEAWERLKHGEAGDFTDFNFTASIHVAYDDENSVLEIEDESGSDYVKFAEILFDYYSESRNPYAGGVSWPMYHEPGYDPDVVPDDAFFRDLFSIDLDESGENIDTTWHMWLRDRFPRLLEVPVCHALHNLFDHSHYSLPDIIRIDDVWSEIRVEWQNFLR